MSRALPICLLTCLLTLCSFFSMAQSKTIDSLLQVLHNTTQDSARIKVYIELCKACDVRDNLIYSMPILQTADKLLRVAKDSTTVHRLIDQRDQGVRFAIIYYSDVENRRNKVDSLLNQQYEISKKYKDPIGVTNTAITMADYYHALGEPLKRLKCMQEGYTSVEKLHFKKGMSRFLVQMAFFFAEQADTSQALYYYDQAVQLEKQINDSTRRSRGFVLNGNFYRMLNKPQLAIDCYLNAEKSYLADKEPAKLSDVYYNMAEAYKQMHNYEQSLLYYKKSIDIGQKTGFGKFIAPSLLASGDLYMSIGNYAKAIEIHKDVIRRAEEGGGGYDLADARTHLAKDYYLHKEYAKAKVLTEKAIAVVAAEQYIPTLLEQEELIYHVDSAMGNYREALFHFQKYTLLKNKIQDVEVQKAGSREKFKNDYEKQRAADKAEQDKKDAISREEKEKQRFILYAGSTGLILLLLLVVFIFRGYRQKQKANVELWQKNELIEQQKLLVEEKHKEITDSIHYAERIQRSFLATGELLDNYLDEYFILFRPRDVVSGDFYWASGLTNGYFALATADSTGHGVPGAIMSLLNISSLEKAIEHQQEPAAILDATRRIIIERLKKDGSAEGGKDGMDCSLCVYDFARMKMYIAAANNPVWIVRNSGMIEIKPDKMPVGKHDRQDIPFSQQEFELQKGDIVYTLTDGFPDQFGGALGKKFMSKKLREWLVSHAHLPIQKQKELLETAFIDWVGDLEQVDDVTIIGIRI